MHEVYQNKIDLNPKYNKLIKNYILNYLTSFTKKPQLFKCVKIFHNEVFFFYFKDFK